MNMYIGNLSYNVRESDLRQVMEEYGTVQSVNKLNGAEYVGRQMVVKEALPRN